MKLQNYPQISKLQKCPWIQYYQNTLKYQNYQINLKIINYQLYPPFQQLLTYPQNIQLLKYPCWSTVTRIQLTATGSSKLKVQTTLSPMVAVVTSHARWWLRIEFPKWWFLQRPINGKTMSPGSVVSWTWQRER